jgi:hypothetical protein
MIYPGYEQICEIEEILAGKCTQLPSKKSLTVEQIAAFVHAPLSSCEEATNYRKPKIFSNCELQQKRN